MLQIHTLLFWGQLLDHGVRVCVCEAFITKLSYIPKCRYRVVVFVFTGTFSLTPHSHTQIIVNEMCVIS